jgi:hypothetical protein
MSSIEDLILHIVGQTIDLESKDKTIIYSLAAQLKKPLSLTANQGSLAVRILEKYKDQLSYISNVSDLLEKPIYKNTFRLVDSSKRIYKSTYLDKECIFLKFPYDRKLNKEILQINLNKFIFDKVNKVNILPFNLKIISKLVIESRLQNQGFIVDQEILDYGKQIEDIKNNPEKYLPLLDIDDDVILKNSNKFLSKYFHENKKNDLIQDIFLARTMKISLSEKIKSAVESMDIDDLTKMILINENNKFLISTKSKITNVEIAKFMSNLKSYPALIMLLDDEYSDFNLADWYDRLKESGINNSEISVLFRSTENIKFNEFIKVNQLNNMLDENTKVVFVRQKIPKILYKLNFDFKVIICTSSFYAHYTAQKLVDTHPMVIFHTKEKIDMLRKNFAKL